MRKRQKMGRKASKRNFTKNAVRKHKKNKWRAIQRGGVAL